MAKINLFWFRRDLRLSDNHGLYRCSESVGSFLPIFIFDKNILDKLDEKSDARVQFIHDTISDLKKECQSLGSDLRVFYGTPKDVFADLLDEFDVQAVYSNEDYEPYAIKRDKEVESLLIKNGIEFKQFKDQCIFAKNDVVKGDGAPYLVYTPFKNKWMQTLTEKDYASYKYSLKKDKLFHLKASPMITLNEIGFDESPIKIPKRVIKQSILENYGKVRDFPAIDGTSKLGIHLRFGTLSVRKAVQVAIKQEDKTWLSELIWREFFMQILFHFPHAAKKSFREKYEKIKWVNSKKDFKAWCEGKTGYPLVDAGMRELNATGHMHNRVRMVTASFLVKHLLVDWRWGEKYFAQKLLDFDLSANNGNWQWVAGTGCDAAPYFRVFNPESQLKKFDKQQEYIKQWAPEYLDKNIEIPKVVEHKFAYDRALLTYGVALGKRKPNDSK